jgi:hypothetical protein
MLLYFLCLSILMGCLLADVLCVHPGALFRNPDRKEPYR